MKLGPLKLNAIHAADLLLQEVQWLAACHPTFPADVRAAADAARIGYPSLEAVRRQLWTPQQDEALAWLAALSRARSVLDQVLGPQVDLRTDPDLRGLARWVNQDFATQEQLAGARVVHEPGRGWTLELGE